MKPQVDANPSSNRILSLDQFRGYAVVAMFIVNYWSHIDAAPALFKHHNTYFSYADSILPAFLFAVGMSFRLTLLRRLAKGETKGLYARYLRRAALLVVVSIILYGFGTTFDRWKEIDPSTFAHFVARFLKADLWEVLAIIGVTQVCVLPWAGRSVRARLVAMLACLFAHALLSQWFNFAFVLGRPNRLDELLGTSGIRAWDGGLLGPISWSVAMLAGTIALDIVLTGQSTLRKVRALATIGIAFMLIAYAFSCLSTLYVGVPDHESRAFAPSPVFPDWSVAAGRSATSVFAEPPFVPPPDDLAWNYWIMSKRVVTATFVLFGSGFSFFVYASFVAVGDGAGVVWGLFRTFGQNPLLAYAIHHLVLVALMPLLPPDSHLAYALLGFALFFGMTYACVRYLEKQNVFLRL